jgi:hypothetical protein
MTIWKKFFQRKITKASNTFQNRTIGGDKMEEKISPQFVTRTAQNPGGAISFCKIQLASDRLRMLMSYPGGASFF